jgi:MEMO1 family protein
MKQRKRVLPAGWYPASKEEIVSQFESWNYEYKVEERSIAAIVPHAGWYFSGKLAYAGIKSLQKDFNTVVVIGGHLPAGAGAVGYSEGEVATPLGSIRVDSRLFTELTKSLDIQEDTAADNTIEIQLPIIKHFFPRAEIGAFRLPPDETAEEFARAVKTAEESFGIRIGVIGSTDLTHYGPSYRFTPKGTGKEAREWVETVNDKRIIDAMTETRPSDILRCGRQDHAACSAGAAAAAARFAELHGITEGRLVDYYTSASIHPGQSFVGYAGVVF